MSSTSIVIKCLHDSKSTGSPHGQITIGTLILQVTWIYDPSIYAFVMVTSCSEGNAPVLSQQLWLVCRTAWWAFCLPSCRCLQTTGVAVKWTTLMCCGCFSGPSCSCYWCSSRSLLGSVTRNKSPRPSACHVAASCRILCLQCAQHCLLGADWAFLGLNVQGDTVSGVWLAGGCCGGARGAATCGEAAGQARLHRAIPAHPHLLLPLRILALRLHGLSSSFHSCSH